MTYDYELFFGENTGTVSKCMLEPTKELLDIARSKDVYFTFFIDVGYLIQADKYPELTAEVNQVKAQIHEMVSEGHDVQLHIHPHWEYSVFKNGSWEVNASGHYKLSDFSKEKSDTIVRTYKNYLEALIERPIRVFRAGGWCVQPFGHLKSVFLETGLLVDSSVIAGNFLMTENYALDFRSAPQKSKYNFEDAVCIEDAKGSFTEYPIASLRYSPLFFWRLYILGRLFPKRHKMIGDGRFISQGSRKKHLLRTFTTGHVSSDGYYSSKLDAAIEKSINMKHEEMVVIGHPKGNTLYSINRLEEFIEKHRNDHSFTTFFREL